MFKVGMGYYANLVYIQRYAAPYLPVPVLL